MTTFEVINWREYFKLPVRGNRWVLDPRPEMFEPDGFRQIRSFTQDGDITSYVVVFDSEYVKAWARHKIGEGNLIKFLNLIQEDMPWFAALTMVRAFIIENNLSGRLHTRDNTNLKRLLDWLEANNEATEGDQG